MLGELFGVNLTSWQEELICVAFLTTGGAEKSSGLIRQNEDLLKVYEEMKKLPMEWGVELSIATIMKNEGVEEICMPK